MLDILDSDCINNIKFIIYWYIMLQIN